MQFSEYQKQAAKTDQAVVGQIATQNDPLLVPLLGLAGEAGELLSECKKYFISGDDRVHFKAIVKEELGDILWYLANVATRFDLKLDDVAFENLVKTQNRWPMAKKGGLPAPMSSFMFDAEYPAGEQLPRKLTLLLEDTVFENRRVVRISMADTGGQVGAKLTDNAYTEDGYRFHDAFHLAYAAVLGWSPVLRDLLERKRRSKPQVDEVEDGGRATAIEEGISALVFADAKDRSMYATSTDVDSTILRIIKNMTGHLEVSVRSYKEWQDAILQRTFQTSGARPGHFRGCQ